MFIYKRTETIEYVKKYPKKFSGYCFYMNPNI